MRIFKSSNEINKFISDKKKENNRIGFIPTMGALHRGHLELVKKSVLENDITVVSIFVNPTQFNNKTDLEKYPRTEKKDLSLLENVGCNIVFMPNVNEMYPEEDKRIFDLNNLDTIMEGEFRPGHFNGVAQIVSKLFEIIMPNNAYFGKKDFQQLAVIKHLNNKYFSNKSINIVGCNIVREDDGLAMSSRNARLTKEHRDVSPLIHTVISKYFNKDIDLDIADIKNKIVTEINNSGLLEVEYFNIVDSLTLKSSNSGKIKDGLTACIAVFAGDIRLIDNISL